MIARYETAFACVCRGAICATALFAGSAQAQDVADTRGGVVVVQARSYGDVVAALEAGGYRVDDISRTFLGRVRIVASNRQHRREVIISRSTGEIMSDMIVDVFPESGTGQSLQPSNGSGAGQGPAGTRESDPNAGQGNDRSATGGIGGVPDSAPGNAPRRFGSDSAAGGAPAATGRARGQENAGQGRPDGRGQGNGAATRNRD